MKTHLVIVRKGPFGGDLRRSLCGRLNKACSDGLNVTDRKEEVTCEYCKRLLPRIPA